MEEGAGGRSGESEVSPGVLVDSETPTLVSR